MSGKWIVFVGRVTAVNIDRSESLRNALVSIEEPFRNVPEGMREINLATIVGLCPFMVNVGDRYIFATVNHSGRYHIGACSPYLPLPGSERMLSALRRQLMTSAPLTGKVFAMARGWHGPADGVIVTAGTGTGKRFAMTDWSGYYEFTDLPAGRYTVNAVNRRFLLDTASSYDREGRPIQDHSGVATPNPPNTVEVNRASCAELNLLLRPAK